MVANYTAHPPTMDGVFRPYEWWLSRTVQAQMRVPAPAKFLPIGMSEEPQQFLLAIRRGVSGYLSSNASASDVLEAARSLHKGMSVCSPGLLGSLFLQLRESKNGRQIARADSKFNLTKHQQRVIPLVAKGLSNKEIAAQLCLSEYTVKNHLSRIRKRVDAESRTAAVQAILRDRTDTFWEECARK